MKALVVDGAERSSLAIARSLGKKGIEVHSTESYRYTPTSLSKYCKKSYVTPNAQTDCTTFIDRLLDILDNGNYDTLYSSREVTTIPISYHKKTLEKYVSVPFPDYEQILMTHDKAKTFKKALEVGIPIPETYFVDSMEELDSVVDSIKFPIVVKSRCKTIWVDGTPSMFKVTSKNYVSDKESLYKISFEILQKSGKMPLIQEYIPGEGYGVEVLFNHGEPRALFMHKRLREYPITGGASTLRESIFNADLKEPALRLMKAMNWHGVAMVEFKIDERDGLPKLMEINGRFWGSLPLAIASGVDFPHLLNTMITDDDVEPVFEYNVGVKCRWLVPGDLLWFGSSIRNRNDKLSVFNEFFSFNGMSYDILSTKDVFPTFGSLRVMLHQASEVAGGKRNMSGEVK